ncbi:NAD(P)H-dependent oxidoreductase [Plebeiibacterium sediminum]|uniref:NAD(P)H-dependent oxidoreductase n=1 Tax=Plebeiibacterium sediminum TaxID=2992112 RepID=A0AAE3SEA1_9BACT|nr:NAD(P)H-dependent oxidoreductase [Plebeiobacterium sediminum]MCW3786001.1 NAD(P)H-dependent oxidoreductase [Plebeiobacterium sediminum]
MKKIFLVYGGKKIANANGDINKALFDVDVSFFTEDNGFEFKYTDINDAYNADEEVDNFLWADAIIYHFPIWWMGMPYPLKEYIDRVFTEGHRKGMYRSDGRKSDNPAINYGTGGLMHGKKYMVTTSWNAPETAFTLPGEFFQQRSVDDGVLFGFHRMNAFVALEPLQNMHFHDIEKNSSPEYIKQLLNNYKNHLSQLFSLVD